MMVFSWFAIVVLGFIALLVVGGLAGLAHLIFSEKARVVGTGLLFGAVLAVMVAAAFGWLFTAHVSSPRHGPPIQQQADVAYFPNSAPVPYVPNPAPPSGYTNVSHTQPEAELVAEAPLSTEAEPVIPIDEPPAAEAARPAWVDKTKNGLVGDVYVQHVTVGPYTSRFEVERNIDAELEKEAAAYVTDLLGHEDAKRVRLAGYYIRQHLIKDQYWDTVQTSFGVPMEQVHLLVHYDPRVAQKMREEFRGALVRDRLWLLGTLAIGVVGLLVTTFGYLKTDLATGGVRRGRLRLATALVVVALASAIVYLVRIQV